MCSGGGVFCLVCQRVYLKSKSQTGESLLRCILQQVICFSSFTQLSATRFEYHPTKVSKEDVEGSANPFFPEGNESLL